jgi:sigma-B regulation protein RsbU (phosphoserine phosphatase)
LVLHPGDNLFLYTDGVTEAMNHRHERYGTERLLEDCRLLAVKSPEELIKEITGIVETFTAGVSQSDDITLLSIAYKG